MSQVTFFSTYHGRGCTSNIIAAATYIAINTKIRTMIGHTQYNRSNLETAYISEREDNSFVNFQDLGIDSLSRLAKANSLQIDDIYNYTKTVISGRLDLLPGSKKSDKLNNMIEESITHIIDVANKAYDIVFIDVNSGFQNEISNKVLRDSDIIVVTLSQDIKLLEDYFKNNPLNEMLGGINKKILTVLGNYNYDSKYTSSYIKKIFNFKDDIYVIPKNVEFMDSLNEQGVVKFFYANNNVSSTDSNYLFINEVKKLALKILELSEINENLVHIPEPKRKFNLFNR